MEFDGVWQSKIAAVSGRNGLKAFLYQRDRVATSALGQKQTFYAAVRESALPPKADMPIAVQNVRLVPIADIEASLNWPNHRERNTLYRGSVGNAAG